MTLNCSGSVSSELHYKSFLIADRYIDVVSLSRIGSQPCAVDWHHHLWPWTAFKSPRSRPQIFLVIYLECRKRCNVRDNGGQIGNHQWASDWRHNLWLWTSLNCASSRSSKLHVKYFKTGHRWDDKVNRSRMEVANGLSINTMDFDIGWAWRVLELSHQTPRQIFWILGKIQSYTQWRWNRKSLVFLRLAPSPLTLEKFEPF